MDKVPFSVYDFFAYLSSGSVLIFSADCVWNLGLLTREKVTPVLGVGLVILAYVLGHVVAHFSSWLLEYGLVKRLLRRPAETLFGIGPRWRLLKLIFPGYYHPLEESTRARIDQQRAARQCAAVGEGLFQHAYPLVSAIDRYQVRLDAFRNLYGFARNMSFAFLVSAVAMFISHCWGQHPAQLRWASLAALAAISLFYRYLKFLWQYSYELFIRYAELPLADGKANSVGA